MQKRFEGFPSSKTRGLLAGGANAPYERFAAGKTSAQAEFISAEHFYQNGAPTQAPCVGSCGGPSKVAVMEQIEQIEGFVAERKG